MFKELLKLVNGNRKSKNSFEKEKIVVNCNVNMTIKDIANVLKVSAEEVIERLNLSSIRYDRQIDGPIHYDEAEIICELYGATIIREKIEQNNDITLKEVNKTSNSIEVIASGGNGEGEYLYYYAKNQNIVNIFASFKLNKTFFDNLEPDTTYFIRAYRAGDLNYKGSRYSDWLEVTTNSLNYVSTENKEESYEFAANAVPSNLTTPKKLEKKLKFSVGSSISTT